MGWTKWRNIEKRASNNPAVYKIRLINENNKPVEIGRLVKTDTGGIPSIGETGNLERRRNQFIKGVKTGGELITKKRGGHSSANKIFVLKKKGIMNIELSNIQYSYCETMDHKQVEGKIIRNYVKNYGETPPFNSNLPFRHVWANSE